VYLTRSGNDSPAPIRVECNLVDIDEKIAHIQLNLEEFYEMSGGKVEDYDNVLVVVSNEEDVYLNFEEKVTAHGKFSEFKIAPLIDKIHARRVQIYGNILLYIVAAAIIISFVVSYIRGSVLMIWICINSMQLFAHIPMIAGTLPSSAHYFILNLLSVLRLCFDHFNSTFDDFSSMMQEYELLSDDSYVYSAKLHNMGYRYNFLHNTLIIGAITLALTLIWVLVAIYDRIRNVCSRTSSSKASISVRNCLIRFMLAIHFELAISSFITLSSNGSPTFWTFLSVGILALSVIAMIALGIRAYRFIIMKKEFTEVKNIGTITQSDID